jgi:hypothetical protein
MVSSGNETRLSRRTVLKGTSVVVAGSTLGRLASTQGSGQRGDHDRNGGEALTFGQQTYVDTDRAGGEPTVDMHPDGTLLYSAHAGTTHFYAPAAADQDTTAFAENYEGQAYYWWSDDLGETWHFADRTTPPDGVPGSGFSDPEFAVDTAGNVYISEINLVNVAVSKSHDAGRSYELQNLFGQVMEDRQWMAAGEPGVLYMTGTVFGGGTVPNDPVGNFGRHLWKSTDGGETFVDAATIPGGEGELQVDKRTGTVYEAHLGDGTLSMGAMRCAREDDFERELNTIAEDVDFNAGWPSFDLDPRGNLYITWNEAGEGGRPAGVYFAASTDNGRTWTDPVRLDGDARTDIWSWMAVGDEGRAAVAWLRASAALPGHDSEADGDHVWKVVAAGTTDGLDAAPDFERAVATPWPVHDGTICDSGTICQAQGVDRRLGDFLTLEIDDTGRMWIAYPDTRQGGAVALPGFVRQHDGMHFRAEDRNPGQGRGPP